MLLTAWMRRWSWVIAMIVSIVITVGGLIILESGRQRLAQQYESALDAQGAAAELYQLLADAFAVVADDRAYQLTGASSYRDGKTASTARLEASRAQLTAYYQRRQDAVALSGLRAALDDFDAHGPALLRGQIAQLIGREQQRASSALDAGRADQRISTFSVAAVSALNIILFIMLFRNLGTQIDLQSREQQQLLIEQEELDRLVRERTRELEALAWHLQTVSENEKTQLARELHDELGSILTASKMDVAWVHDKLRVAATPAAQPLAAQMAAQMVDKLARALGALDQGIALKRRIVEDMRPTVLANFGLATALRTFVEEAAQRNNWSTRLSIPDDDVALDEAVAIALFRVAQEALTNAAKYAQATRIGVSLAFDDGRVTLEITDNGIGITEADLQRTKAHGLLGMRQRVAARGGVFDIFRRLPCGTGIRVVMPVDKSEDADTRIGSPPTATPPAAALR